MSDLDFVSVSPAPGTPMDKSVRGGVNPFLSCLQSGDAGTPSNHCAWVENPFAQFASGQETSGSNSSARSFLPRGATSAGSSSDTPMNRSLRSGENPFLGRGGPSVDSSPMSQSM